LIDEKRDEIRRFAGVINDGWNFSWHWDGYKRGYLTMQGYRQVLHDAREQAKHFRKRALEIEAIIPEIENRILEGCK